MDKSSNRPIWRTMYPKWHKAPAEGAILAYPGFLVSKLFAGGGLAGHFPQEMANEGPTYFTCGDHE